MSTINEFKTELTALKDSIGSDLVPALEELSSLIDESISVLGAVETHDMDIKKKDFKSIITAVNDELDSFKGVVKNKAKIRFSEIWTEQKDSSLKAIRDAEVVPEPES